MILRFSSVFVGMALLAGCARSNAERDSQIGQTTYDGSEHMVPASGSEAPNPNATATPLGNENAASTAPTSTPAPEPEPAVSNMAAAEPDTNKEKKPDVIYVPTPQPIVDKMLELARVTKTDVVYDLGCGDGRIVVTAAKRYKARAVGFDIDPERVAEAKANVKKAKVEDLVTIEQKDIFTLDLTPASVVTLYLLPKLNDRLVPQLEKLAPGARVVSHDYDFSGMVPVKAMDLKPRGEDRDHSIFFYTMPFKREAALSLPPPTVAPPSAR